MSKLAGKILVALLTAVLAATVAVVETGSDVPAQADPYWCC